MNAILPYNYPQYTSPLQYGPAQCRLCRVDDKGNHFRAWNKWYNP